MKRRGVLLMTLVLVIKLAEGCNSDEWDRGGTGTDCVPCDSTCLRCDGDEASNCTACDSTTFLSLSTCVNTCPPYTNGNITTRICDPCSTSCLTCTSPSVCTACDSTTFLSLSTCVNTCPPYTNGNITTRICDPCSTSCLTCTSPSVCTACDSTTFLSLSTCVNTCPPYTNGNITTRICDPCSTSCLTCTSPSVCTACDSTTFLSLSTCVNTCPPYTNGNITTRICDPCSTSCLTCTSPSVCTACDSTTFLSLSTCVNTCPPYTNGNITTRICDPCSTSCLTCTSPSVCTACDSTTFLSLSTCVNTCPPYTNGNITTRICDPCSTSCLTCTSPSVCTACDSTTFLSLSTCVNTCPPYTNGNITTRICDPCSTSCLTCTSPSVCTACDSTTFLSLSTCVNTCPPYTNGNITTRICDPCSTSCLTCTSPSVCTACDSTTFLSLSTCVNTCPPYTNGNITTRICDPCSTSCLTCTSPSVCTACDSTTFLSLSTCVNTCPPYTNGNITTRICDPCSTSCLTCTSPSVCTACDSTTFLSLSTCVNTCPPYTNGNITTRICDPCSTSCLTCTSPSVCTACDSTTFLSLSTCVNTCPPYTNGNITTRICDPCSTSCLTCTSPSVCTACDSTTFLSLSTCVNTCPPYTNGNITTRICDPCSTSCLTCTSPSVCTACDSTTFLSLSTCVAICPFGTFPNITSRACEYCTNSCESCLFSSTYCLSCVTNTYLYNHMCLNPCPPHYFANFTTNVCDQCDSNCYECINISTRCTSCSGSKSLFVPNSTCQDPCPPGYFNSSNVCKTYFCSAFCLTCNGITENNCTNCASNLIYFSGVGNCVPNASYLIALETGTTTIFSNNSLSSTCGQYISIPGMYASGQTVQLFALTDLAPHYQYRIRMWFMWVDNWENNTKIQVINAATSSQVAAAQYSSASGYQQNECGLGYLQRSNKIDQTPNHASSTLTLLAVADTCSNPSECGWYYKDIIILLVPCHVYCSQCTGPNPNQCSNCTTYLGVKYLLSGTTCAATCASNYYVTSTNTCSLCTAPCKSCQSTSTNCTSCNIGFIFFPPNNTCLNSCPIQFYFNTTTTKCEPCNILCKTCTAFPSPCQSCTASAYFLSYNSTCWETCPSPYLPLAYLMKCLTIDDYYVNLTISLTMSASPQSLTVSILWSQPMDFTTFPYKQFQSVTFLDSSVTVDKFSVSYSIVNSTCYQMKLIPVGTIFMSNTTTRVSTQQNKTTLYTSIYNIPISDSCYGQNKTTIWNFNNPPTLTDTEQSFVTGLSGAASAINTALSDSYIQDLKMLGVPLLFFNFLQVPAMLLLLNVIHPESFYQGTRVMASLVLLDVPAYEQPSTITKKVFSDPVNEVTSRRLLIQTIPSLAQFRFNRTGFTGYFLIDCYSNLILIGFSLLLTVVVSLIAKCCRWGDRVMSYVSSFRHKVHEVVLFFFTLSIVLEVETYDATSFGMASIAVGIIANLYILFYYVRMFYQLHSYKLYAMNSKRRQECAITYGLYLRNIRFEEKEQSEECRHFKEIFEPYQFHVLSYYKKTLMLLTVCIFYPYPTVQIATLISLQLLEIIRFIIVRPYNSTLRNVARGFLEVALLILFSLVLGQLLIINVIQTSTDMGINSSMGVLWIRMGWVSLSFLWIYCLGHLVIWTVNLGYGIKYTNLELMNTNMKAFYYGKIENYEDNNLEAPPQLLKDWVERGELVERPDANTNKVEIECEEISIKKAGILSYLFGIKRPLCLKMSSNPFNINTRKCSVRIENRLDKVIEVSRKGNPSLFNFLNTIYTRFKTDSELSNVVIKTFVEIDQSRYTSGQTITLLPEMRYTHQVHLSEALSNADNVTNIDTKLPDFPLDMGLMNKVMFS